MPEAGREPIGDALCHEPQFSPDGQSLYFISDQGRFKDVYRVDLPRKAYYARPFERRGTTWELGFRIAPGF